MLWDFIFEHGIEIAIIGGGCFGAGIFAIIYSKYLSFREIYLQDESGRVPKYLGRKVSYNEVKDDKKKKGVMKYLERGWFNTSVKKLTIPRNIDFEKSGQSKLLIRARNVRYEYNTFKSLVPTNKEFQSIHPDEPVFNDEISDKIDVTDREVRQATNVNPEVSKFQKTSGSIPLSAQREKSEGFMSEQLDKIGKFSQDAEGSTAGSGDKDDFEEDEEKEEQGYKKSDATDDLESLLEEA